MSMLRGNCRRFSYSTTNMVRTFISPIQLDLFDSYQIAELPEDISGLHR
jgi:hypothetical protein